VVWFNNWIHYHGRIISDHLRSPNPKVTLLVIVIIIQHDHVGAVYIIALFGWLPLFGVAFPLAMAWLPIAVAPLTRIVATASCKIICVTDVLPLSRGCDHAAIRIHSTMHLYIQT